VFVYFFVEIVG